MRKSSQSGFTVLELMIVIALLAILTVIAVPSFRSAIQNNRITAQTNDLITAFQLARSEAVKRGRPVSVCASDVIQAEIDGTDPVCDTSGDWSQGWLAFVDGLASEGSNSVTLTERIRAWSPVATDADVAAPTGAEFLRFLPRGNVDDGSGATLPVSIDLEISDCTGDQYRRIQISMSGTVSSERLSCP